MEGALESGRGAGVGGTECVLQEQGNGHETDAAGNGRDGGAFGGYGIKIDITDQAIASFAGGVVDAVNTDIDHGGVLPDHISGDESGFTDGGDEDIGGPGNGWEILGAGVADGDGGVGEGGFTEEEESGGFADDEGTTENDDMASFGRDVVTAEHFDDTGGGTGDESLRIFLDEAAEVGGGKAVDILVGGDSVEDGLLVNVVGQGRLDEDCVDGGVLVEGVDLLEQIAFGDGIGKSEEATFDADGGRFFLFGSDIKDGGGIFADADKGDAGRWAGALGDALGDFVEDAGRELFTVQKLHKELGRKLLTTHIVGAQDPFLGLGIVGADSAEKNRLSKEILQGAG